MYSKVGQRREVEGRIGWEGEGPAVWAGANETGRSGVSAARLGMCPPVGRWGLELARRRCTGLSSRCQGHLDGRGCTERTLVSI